VSVRKLVTKTIRNLIRQKEGPLTRELVQKPSKFGLGKIPERLIPDEVTSTICGYCSTGCGLNVHLAKKKPINLTPDNSYPVNSGMACPKGWEALSALKSEERATVPLLKNEKGDFEECTWNTALNTFTNEFKAIQNNHGEESVAFLSTGQITSEEMFYLGSLTKFGMGIKHGDGNTRQCMATAVVAYKQSFGFDAPPYTYQDFELSDTIVFIGANPCIAHPIMWERVCKNPHNPNIIVIDPRKTETAMAATHHYGIKPKSDLTFFYAIANILIKENWLDKNFIEQHTSQFNELKYFLEDYTIEKAEAESGIEAAKIFDLAKIIGQGQRVSFWWTMGVNQSHQGVRTAQAIINLALMTGNIGKPGTGANSITGQCNAMGSRLFSNTTNLLGGHEFGNADDRKKVSEILDIDEEKIPSELGASYDQIIEKINNGTIKGLWVICTNPGHSWIDQKDFEEAMKKLDFLVVQDIYKNTATAKFANLILPAAGWGEKEGTLINSERRIGLIKKVSVAPGLALADFHIFQLIATYWGCDNMFKKWKTPEDVFHLMKKITKGQPCDFSGISGYDQINNSGGIQWPFRNKTIDGGQQRRLFQDRLFYHEDQKARFYFEKPISPIEDICGIYPFILMSGRGSSAQWHTQTRTKQSKVLAKLYSKEIYIEINTEDAHKFRIKEGDKVHVKSRRGSLIADALISPNIQRGQVFIPMHYEEINKLTYPSFDPYSKQPSFKYSAVKILRC